MDCMKKERKMFQGRGPAKDRESRGLKERLGVAGVGRRWWWGTCHCHLAGDLESFIVTQKAMGGGCAERAPLGEGTLHFALTATKEERMNTFQ